MFRCLASPSGQTRSAATKGLPPPASWSLYAPTNERQPESTVAANTETINEHLQANGTFTIIGLSYFLTFTCTDGS
jgi:hypothetical protein